MFAFVSNEYQGIVYSKDSLRLLSNVYSYPIAQYCRTEQECREFIRQHPREIYSDTKRAGWKKNTAYVRVEYFIADNTIYSNVYTDHFRYVQFNIRDRNILQQVTYDTIKLKIMNVSLDDNSISSHCVAIGYILNLFSSIINVQLIVPDLSVYLALTEYCGGNAGIKRVKKMLDTRIGKVALLLK